MDTEWKAMAISGFVIAPPMLFLLRSKGLLSTQECRELLEQAQTALETFQMPAGPDAPAVERARELIEIAIQDLG